MIRFQTDNDETGIEELKRVMFRFKKAGSYIYKHIKKEEIGNLFIYYFRHEMTSNKSTIFTAIIKEDDKNIIAEIACHYETGIYINDLKNEKEYFFKISKWQKNENIDKLTPQAFSGHILSGFTGGITLYKFKPILNFKEQKEYTAKIKIAQNFTGLRILMLFSIWDFLVENIEYANPINLKKELLKIQDIKTVEREIANPFISLAYFSEIITKQSKLNKFIKGRIKIGKIQNAINELIVQRDTEDEF